MSLQLEKLHAFGYKPLLLLGKDTKKKCELLTLRCTLTAFAQDYLQKIASLYEYVCEGEKQAQYFLSRISDVVSGMQKIGTYIFIYIQKRSFTLKTQIKSSTHFLHNKNLGKVSILI